jgi:Calcineurin-like phosphoesterase
MNEGIYIVGDVHGCVRTLARVLRRARLLDSRWCWSGGRSSLYFVGGFTDRGPDGIGVLDLAMRLQDQAQSAGGHIGAILGNHDLFLLAADRFGRTRPSHEFVAQWRRNGGRVADLEKLHTRHRAWLASHPAMRRVGEVLLVHADTVLYGAFGDTLEAVNAAVAAIVASADEEAWDVLCAALTAREAFLGPQGAARARAFLTPVRRHADRTWAYTHPPPPWLCTGTRQGAVRLCRWTLCQRGWRHDAGRARVCLPRGSAGRMTGEQRDARRHGT